MMNRLLVILCSALLLSSCGRQTAAPQEEGDTVRFRHAQLLSVVRHEGYTVATIRHPWRQDAVLHRYVLVRADRPLPDPLPEGTLLRTPLSRSVVFTTVHCSLLQMLHRQEAVAGVADLKYIKAPYVHDGVRSGRIADCGDGMSPVIEKIIDAEADGILLSPFENSGGYGRLEEVDIPLIECAEYMEASPLARAEWLRFYGMLYGRERQADSLFAVVDSTYQALKQLALTSKVRRSVLIDKQTSSVWYVPGGHSTIGQMLQDAQCDYPFADHDHSGSLSLPFETVLERAGQADVWLFRYDAQQPITRQRLLSEQPGYPQLRPVREGELYGCNVMTSMFYEESPFRPDLLLGDFIQILHPDIPNLPPRRYYFKVE